MYLQVGDVITFIEDNPGVRIFSQVISIEGDQYTLSDLPPTPAEHIDINWPLNKAEVSTAFNETIEVLFSVIPVQEQLKQYLHEKRPELLV